MSCALRMCEDCTNVVRHPPTLAAGTLFAAAQVLAIGLQSEVDDLVQRIRGVGGAEFISIKRIDRLSVGELQVSDFDIEVGAMDYGLAIDGITGTDFLRRGCCTGFGARLTPSVA